MNALSLCSGYGGLDLAVEEVYGATIVAHAENDPKAAAVHERHWPGIPNYGDITTADWAGLSVDIICAGFPCQPVSQAGKRKVRNDDRWLWPHIAECVRVLRPRHVILENVPGLLAPWRDGRWWRPAPVEEVVGDLARLGHVGRWRSVRASDVGAPHRRERVFFQSRAADADIITSRAEPVGESERHGEMESRLHRPTAADPERERPARPATGDRWDETNRQPAAGDAGDRHQTWGRYAQAIERWERLTRPAPAPMDDQRRLDASFVEWMMGLPDGWVTATTTRRQALQILGNGVVPQQATVALRLLEAME